MKIQPQTDSLKISRLKRWSIYCAGVVVVFSAMLTAVALLVLAGWQWDIGWLKHPWPGLVVMNPVTAMTFLLSGLSLLMLIPRRRSGPGTTAGLALASLVVGIGLLRLLSVEWPEFWRVDYLLYSDKILSDIRARLAAPRTTSPSTAVTFILSGAALLLLPVRRRAATAGSQLLAVGIGLIGLFTLVCYLYGVKELDNPAVTLPMAAPSTVCFLLLCFGLLFAKPGKGIMRQVTGPYSGSLMARRSVAFALVVPIILGWAALFSPWRDSVSIQLSAVVLVIGIFLFSLVFIGYITVLLNHRDLTTRQVRQELLASEERFRLMVESVKDYAIIMLDTAGRVVSWNETATRISGYTAGEIMGKSNSVFYGPQEIKAGAPGSNLQRIINNDHTIREGWQLRKDGTRYWAEVAATAIRSAGGQLQGFAVVVRDLTANKQAQDKIAYQARLMEDSSDAIFAVDAGYRFVSFNKAAEALYGYDEAEVTGRSITEVLRTPMSDETRAEVREELLDVGYWKGLVVYHSRNKGPLDIAVSISRTQDERGRIDGYIMVCRDMTERLQAEAKLRQFNEELERLVEEKTLELQVSNTELRDLTSRLQRIREEERGAIAREIHDELGQQLTGLKMDLFWVSKRLDGQTSDQVRQKLRSTMSLLDETIQTVRRIATDLRPSILDDLGLIAAIEWQSQEFEKRAGIRTVFQSTVPEIEFPSDMAIGIFRICQESLTNVARHASASRVSITFDPVEGGVCMAISDDGNGLDPGRVNPKTLGLIGMKERALMMGGRLEMGNGDTKGFRLAVTVPLPPVLSA
ncbi:MAG TPA: PAS domain S-box protein [Puia sp.]|jgi:PAS domain S-box-containing protein|nr:PAS domain S-box protein [Puia sp.]